MKTINDDRAPLAGGSPLPSTTPAHAGDRNLEQLLAGSRVMTDRQGRDRNR